MQTTTDSIRQAYLTDGFYIHPEPLLPPAIIARGNEGMDAVRRGESDTGHAPLSSRWNPGDDETKLCKMELPQLSSMAVRELLNFPALGALAAAVTGAQAVQVWWVQLLHKPPATGAADQGTVIGWHQDRSYWGCWEEGSELFTAWVALSDVAADCGPMRFVRGSQRWGLLSGGDFYGQDLAAQRTAMGVPAGAEWSEVAATMPAGGVSFHDCLTLHGSDPNTSALPRRSFAIHMRTERSRPVDGKRAGLTAYLDDREVCPVIYGELR